ncbi:conserved Plasmodium protein, unknown function [Plasmodium chabaudi chabaudi]|uniref:Uncharacterized protein n=1 Tax=Plasmodium chabaudi chabaudi TaxID=31271 RepID=A0A4V0K9I7_PLACU|nr:conserved Plasmodium protein, unknown function [Plasmodium chabaudi chabaudi]VTZ69708.1 conserved Plasmodium protein, unknown function [Plasmodium chabaudi chabaudi]|eukprot:XP_741396.2 conserved Plasmodium protein, unknown function [Plasmodium chabaudi chabaudi]
MAPKRGSKKNATKNAGKKNNKGQENEEGGETDNNEISNGHHQNNILLIGDDNLSFCQFVIDAYPDSNLYIASTLTELEINYMLRDLEMKKQMREKNEQSEESNENSGTDLDTEIVDNQKIDPFYYTKKFKEQYPNNNIHLIFNTNLFSLRSYFPTNFFHTIFLILPGICYNIKEKGLRYSDQLTTLRLYYFIILTIVEIINVSIKNVQVHIFWTTEKLKSLVENNNIVKSEINKEGDEKNDITATLTSLKNLVCNPDGEIDDPENANQISEEKEQTQSDKDGEDAENDQQNEEEEVDADENEPYANDDEDGANDDEDGANDDEDGANDDEDDANNGEVDIKLSNDPNICLDQDNVDAENDQEENLANEEEQTQKEDETVESDWVDEPDETEKFDGEDKDELLDLFNLKNDIITKTVSELNEMEQSENDQIIYFVENKIKENVLMANMWGFPLLYEVDLNRLMRFFNFESGEKEESNEDEENEEKAEVDTGDEKVEIDLKINIDSEEISNQFFPIIYGKHFIYNKFLTKCKFYSFVLKKSKKISIPEELAVIMQNNITGKNYNIETYKQFKKMYYSNFKEEIPTYETIKEQAHHIANIRYKLYLHRNQNNNMTKQYMPFHIFQTNLNTTVKHKIVLDELWKKVFTPMHFVRSNEDINKYFEFFIFSKLPSNRTIHKINKLYLKFNINRRMHNDNTKYGYTQNYKNNNHYLVSDNKHKPPLLPTPGRDMHKHSNYDQSKYNNMHTGFKKMNSIYKNTSSYNNNNNTTGMYNKMYRHDKSRNISNNYEHKRDIKNRSYGRSGENNTHRSMRPNNMNSQNNNNNFGNYNRGNHDSGSYNNVMNKSYNNNNRGTSHNHGHNMMGYNNKGSRNSMHKSGDIRRDLKSIDGRSDTRGGGGRSQARSDFYNNNNRYDNKNIKRRRDDSFDNRRDEENDNYSNRRFDKKIRNNDYDMKSRINDGKNQKKYSRNNTEMQDPYASTKDSNKYYDTSNNGKNSEKKNWKFPPPPPNIPPLYDGQSQKRNSSFYHGNDDY